MRRNVPSTAAGRPSKVQVARGTGKDMPKSRAAKAASSERLAMVNGTGCIAMCRVLERGEQTNARTTIFLQVIGEPSRTDAISKKAGGKRCTDAARSITTTAGAAGTHSLIHVTLPNTRHSHETNPHCTKHLSSASVSPYNDQLDEEGPCMA